MRITIPHPTDHVRNILRRAGYSEYVDRNTHKTSYAKRLGADLFPKFHCYAEQGATSATFDLHIDQKQVSYEGSSMHSGEYDGPLVERELQRIAGFATVPQSVEPPQKKGFFATLFGVSDRDE